MTTKRTQTLAKLRKLAKRKGQDYAEIKYGNGSIQVGVHKYGGKCFWLHAWNFDVPSPRRVAFAALSVLPDSKGGRR